MKTDESLRDVITRFNEPDPDIACKAVLDEIGMPAKWRAWVAPLVRDECRRLYRNETRRIEHIAERSDDAPSSDPDAMTPAEAREALLFQTFDTPNGRVLWGEATVADHMARIEFLESYRRGLQRTIDQHRDAIARIEAAGVSCLSEIKAAA